MSENHENHHRFQVNLRGMIDLLSRHIYSSPRVYIRELLQNATDALQARRNLDPDFQGQVHIEIHNTADAPPTLLFEENGIGLSEAEVHEFVATIGQSSKTDPEQAENFIGRFGIGLLSCFMVSDEIVLLTRSARDQNAPGIEWRGKPDGTYSIKRLDEGNSQAPPATSLYLRCKPGEEEYFDPELVEELVRYYGSLLPYPIYLTYNDRKRHLNGEEPPWRRTFESHRERDKTFLNYGADTFGRRFMDYIPIHCLDGELEGVAYVLPSSVSLTARQNHRIYLKGMLLTQKADALLPDWAFFVKCVFNTTALTPTASREEFYEDAKLARARFEIGEALRAHLLFLAREAPEQLLDLIEVHFLSIKALVAQDEECFRIFIDWLPFETSMGRMTMGHIRKEFRQVRYIRGLEQFRKIAGIAASQGICVVNTAYVYDLEILENCKTHFKFPEFTEIDALEISESFQVLSAKEQIEVNTFLERAVETLAPFNTSPVIRRFLPDSLPALFVSNHQALFERNIMESQELADDLFEQVLEGVAQDSAGDARSELFFNFSNALIRQVALIEDAEFQGRVIELLYVQALLLGQHRPGEAELKLLNNGLGELIKRAAPPG